MKSYINRVAGGVNSLATGLGVTLKEFFTKKVTECYPENRDTLKIPERFRATLVMPTDENGKNKCIACGICQTNCPTGTIKVEYDTVEEEGKKKKVLTKYTYDLGSCLYCQLCVNTCPTGAIEFSNDFEQAVFNREKLFIQLNK